MQGPEADRIQTELFFMDTNCQNIPHSKHCGTIEESLCSSVRKILSSQEPCGSGRKEETARKEARGRWSWERSEGMELAKTERSEKLQGKRKTYPPLGQAGV